MTIEQRLDGLEQELNRVKRRNTWLLVAFGLAMSVAFIEHSTTAQAQGQVGVIRAKAFVLEDAKGHGRAMLAVLQDEPVLNFYDEKGLERVRMRTTSSGSELLLFDDKGSSPLVQLDVTSGNGNAIFTGKRSRIFAGHPDGAHILLSQSNDSANMSLGTPALRVSLGVDKSDSAFLMADQNSHNRIALDVTKDGPALTFSDENGHGRATLGSTQTVSPDGRTTTYPESSLLLFGPNGNVLWSAPR